MIIGVGIGAEFGYLTRTKILVSDTFQRTNSTVGLGNADTGQTWVVAGNYGIISNQAYMSSGSLATAYISSGYSDCAITVKETAAGESGRFSGLIIRHTNSSNYIRAVFQDNGLFLQRIQAGETTSIGFKTVTRSANLILRAVIKGDSIQIFMNGELQISATESFNSTAQNHGLITAALNARYDNFIVEAV